MLMNLHFMRLRHNTNSGFKIVSLVFIFIFVFVLLFSRAMLKGLSHDEYQFVTSGVMLADRGLLPYVDYPFLHMPYIAFFNALATKFTMYDLLAARSLSVICEILNSIVIFAIAYRLLRDFNESFRYISGIFAVALFIFNPVFIGTEGRALNHTLPSFLSLAAYFAFLKGKDENGLRLWYFLCGVLAGLAVCVRLSYAVLLPAFSCILIIYPFGRSLSKRIKDVSAFGAGVFLALLPALLLFFAAPKQFIYGNYIYIRLNTLYRQTLGYSTSMTLSDKVSTFFQSVLNHPINMFLYFPALLYTGYALFRFFKTRDPDHFEALAVAGISLGLFLSAFAPTPLWPQYFFAPLPFLVILLLYALRDLGKMSLSIGYAAMGSLAFIFFLNGIISSTLSDLNGLRNPETWQPVQIHEFAKDVKTYTQEGKVLTLAPIIPLEAGLDTYEMFAVGPFSWRTAQILGEDKRQEYSIISFHELEEFLEADPPQAILTGMEENNEGFLAGAGYTGWLEKPFIDYAKKYGYSPVDIPIQFADIHPVLWVR
jgi:4-amino-4-deoxy-L-arabinose transferase-like glycosyltransferase